MKGWKGGRVEGVGGVGGVKGWKEGWKGEGVGGLLADGGGSAGIVAGGCSAVLHAGIIGVTESTAALVQVTQARGAVSMTSAYAPGRHRSRARARVANADLTATEIALLKAARTSVRSAPH